MGTKHETVSHELRTALQKARTAKGMTQKALATALNERAQLINEYESGKAIPNTQLSKDGTCAWHKAASCQEVIQQIYYLNTRVIGYRMCDWHKLPCAKIDTFC